MRSVRETSRTGLPSAGFCDSPFLPVPGGYVCIKVTSPVRLIDC